MNFQTVVLCVVSQFSHVSLHKLPKDKLLLPSGSKGLGVEKASLYKHTDKNVDYITF